MLSLGQLFLVLASAAAQHGSVAPVLLQRQQSLHDTLIHEVEIHSENNASNASGRNASNASRTNGSNESGSNESGSNGSAAGNNTKEKRAEKDAEKVLKWLEKMFGASNSSNACQADGPPGALVGIVESAKSPDILSLDLTNAFKDNEVVQILVTTMVTDGSYVEGQGFLTTLGMNTDMYLELQLDRERSVVNVYHPQMALRTSDTQSQEAVDRGAGDGWLDVLPMSTCPSPLDQNVVVDASPLVAKMFYTFQLDQVANYRIVSSQAYLSNMDLTVEYLSVVPVSLGFSLQVLPAVPMTTRAADDRLLYFTSDFKDIGYHLADWKTLPSQAVDRETSIIWRWDLSKLQNRTIRIYVDPTVPLRWRSWVKQGVEAWNSGFQLLEQPAFVKAVLPDDDDWPLDYDLADARYSTISWSISDEISSEGDAKVDPRTGEIIKADIRMGEGWVWAWLKELDLMAPNITHAQRMSLLASHRSDASSRRTEHRRQLKRLKDVQRHKQKQEMHQSGKELPESKTRGLSASLLFAALGPMSKEQLEALMGAGLQSVIMHETGHILGLRHNFKGSTAISQKCLQNISCTARNSITSSVMDYLPLNLPKNHTPVHIFPPTIGAYDQLAIRYGYTEGLDPASLTAELNSIMFEAEKFDVCYDADEGGEDPYCMAEDLGEDPVAFQEDQIKRLAEAQHSLHKTFVQADGPWRLYGAAVKSLFREALYAGHSLIPWIGGIQNHYSHRAAVWNSSKARQPVPLGLQRRALEALLTLLRPNKAGLLPPAEAMPFLVEGEVDEVRSIDLAENSELLIKFLLKKLLSKKKLIQIRKQELLLVQRNVSKPTVFTVADFLTRMGDSILGGFHLHLENPKAAVPSTVEMTLQLEYVRHMRELYLSKELPESLEAQLLLQMRQLRADTRAAETRLKVVHKEQPPVLEAHLALLNRELGTAFCSPEETPCLPPRVRETLRSAAWSWSFPSILALSFVTSTF